MRGVALSVAAGVLLAGCGSSASSPAPVDASIASGIPAAAGEPCAPGPPASGVLNVVGDPDFDGVVGSLRNYTGQTLWVRGQTSMDPCRLDEGRSAAFAGPDGKNTVPGWAKFKGDSSFLPAGDPSWVILLVSRGPELSAPGVLVALIDPIISRPSAFSVYRTAAGDVCPTAKGPLDTGGISENGEYTLAGPAPGQVVIKRLPDSKEAVHEWAGKDSGNLDDWARMDVTVMALGSC